MRFFVLAFALCLISIPALANCADPLGIEGDLVYNADCKVPQFCNGAIWIALSDQSQCATGGGYFVLTNGTWNGDLLTASGEATWQDAANTLCLNDLTANDWNGKADAQARGLLDSVHVKGWLCDRWNGCNNVLASTTYKFAVSGDAAKGGASFTADASSSGPGNTENWSGVNYFGGDYIYWTGRESGTDTAWGFNNDQNSLVCETNWSKTSGGGYIGTSNKTDAQRWSATLTCTTLNHLVCMVHP